MTPPPMMVSRLPRVPVKSAPDLRNADVACGNPRPRASQDKARLFRADFPAGRDHPAVASSFWT
jgi:hypothetical protein